MRSGGLVGRPLVLALALAILAAGCATDRTAPRLAPSGTESKGARAARRRAIPPVLDVATPASFEGDLRRLPSTRWRPGDPVREAEDAPVGRGAPDSRTAPPGARGPDPLLALQLGAAGTGLDGDLGVLLLDREGQGFSGVSPPDPTGDVGGVLYVQAINGGGVAIYDKVGATLVAGPFALRSLAPAGTPCAGNLGFDPFVLYDEQAHRWLLAEVMFGPPWHLCVYVSKTADPLAGGWWAYDFLPPGTPDYPHLAVWPQAFVVSSNPGRSSAAVHALDRQRMLAGSPAAMQTFTTSGLPAFDTPQLLPAAEPDGPPPPAGGPVYLVRHRADEAHDPPGATGTDWIELYQLSVDWSDPSRSLLGGPQRIAVADFSSYFCGYEHTFCLPQPATTNRLDALQQVVSNRPVYRNFGSHESIVGSFTVNVAADPASTANAAVRWFELRRAGGGPFALHQEGTLGDAPCSGDCDYLHRWMPSTAMDSEGNVAVAYAVVSERTTLPGLAYAGRLASDPLGTLPQGEHVVVAGTADIPGGRFGDYFHLAMDSSDGCTFHFTGQYGAGTQWATRLASFRFAGCRGLFRDGFEAGTPGGWSGRHP